MSFNVTQCPACESTFNTNSRVLAAAAGRVRCGACLNVFEAIDNFLIPEEADSALDQDESVFVGNDPQEYFDPSSFLTRSALSETHDNEATTDDAIDEQNLHQELEQSETVSADFFTAVAGELQGRTEAPAIDEISEDEQPLIDQPTGPQAHTDNEGIDEEFEEELLESFAAQATDAHELTENDPVDRVLEEVITSEPATTNAEDTHKDNKESFLGSGLSASFTFDPHAQRGFRTNKPKLDTSPDRETASEQLVDSSTENDTEANFNEDNENTDELLPDVQPEALEADTQAPYDSTSSQITDEVTDPPPNEETAQVFTAEHTTTESNAATEPSADPVEDYQKPSIDNESPNDETDKNHSLAKQEEPPPENIAENEYEEPTLEAPKTNTSEVDEESTEAIRARALRTELSDEEALEAIPQENLAALGNMSTPLELLARRESRVLRSTLLSLSILLLAGLLSSQYLWQRMELYSQLPQLRPLYEVACSYLNCTLPEYADIDAIRSENLTVQTHPTLANGLMVNTVIRNTAAFEQAFPILILSFNSAQNSIIALREFTSAEYLDPGLRSIQAMPAMTPVQIELAIMDPGTEAVNYTLAFRRP